MNHLGVRAMPQDGRNLVRSKATNPADIGSAVIRQSAGKLSVLLILQHDDITFAEVTNDVNDAYRQ